MILYFLAKPNIFTNKQAPRRCPARGPSPSHGLPRWRTASVRRPSAAARSSQLPQADVGQQRPHTLTVVRGWMSYLENLACQVLPAFLYPSKQHETTNKILECNKVLSNSGNFSNILLYAASKLKNCYNHEEFSFSLPQKTSKVALFYACERR